MPLPWPVMLCDDVRSLERHQTLTLRGTFSWSSTR